MMTSLPSFLIYDKGKIGTLRQLEALTRALGLSPETHAFKSAAPWKSLPTWAWPSSCLSSLPPLPQKAILLGGGRHSAWVLKKLKQKNPNLLTIQLFKGDCSAKDFDLLLSPHHDVVIGPNVLSFTGALANTSSDRKAQARDFLGPQTKTLSKPLLGVLIGGPSKTFSFNKDDQKALFEALESWCATTNGSCVITTSRRTPSAFVTELTTWCTRHPSLFLPWEEQQNPLTLPGILEVADHLLLTQDSISMAMEASTTGKPVSILPLHGGSSKFNRFYERFFEKGYGYSYAGTFDKKGSTQNKELLKIAKHIDDSFQHYNKKLG